MVSACFCLSLRQGVRAVAFCSLLCGVIVATVGSWALHRSMRLVKNPVRPHAELVLWQLNQFIGVNTNLYDIDSIFRILVTCTATACVGGFLQFLLSFWLLMASLKGGRNMALVWVILHIFILIAIGGSFLCIMTNELQLTMAIQVFLPITGVDFLLLIYFSWVVFAYSRGIDEEEDEDRPPYFTSPRVTSTTVTEKSSIEGPLRTPRKDKPTGPPMQTDF